MYYILFIIIAVAFFLELKTQKTHKEVFMGIYILITGFCVFRFGQGTDYFNYRTIYEASYDLKSWVFDKDVGFSYLCHIFVRMGMPYPYFSGLIALLTMVIIYPFFNTVCNKSMFPIFIFYSYLYLIYPMSGIRQGLTIAILLGVLYPLMINKRYLYFYIGLLVGSSIHLSLIVCAVLPFLGLVKIRKSTLCAIVGIFTLIMFLNLNLSNLIPASFQRGQGYIENLSSSYNIFAKIFRFLIIVVILSIPESKLVDNVKGIRNIVVFGYILYSALSFSDILAGRIETYFRVFEMLLVFMLAYGSLTKFYFRRYIVLFFFLYTPLWFKNVQSQIDQGEYINKSILSYPYISIFQPNDIRKHRKNYYDNEFFK